MANRYANLEGSKKISEDFGNINVGFDRVQAEMDTKGTPADAQAKADAAKAAAIAAAAADLAAHKQRGADEHPTAKGNAAGFMSAADKLIVDGRTSAATPDTLMQRDAEGRAKVAAPAAADDIARKAETDAVQTKLDSHAADTVKHVTQAEHDKLNGIAAGAEVNQNAFSKINDVSAGSKTDTVTFVGGTGITVTTNPTTKQVTVTATGEATPGAHAPSHLPGGTDVIPDAVTGGLSGLMSGADAKFVRQDGETKTGAQAKANAAEQAANEYTDQKVGEIVIDEASLTDKGIVQLSEATDSQDVDKAATPSAVKKAYDLALAAQAVINNRDGYGTTTNSGNAYSVSATPAPTALVAGLRVTIKVNAANTGAVTLNVNGFGAKSVLKSNGGAMTSGALKVNSVYSLVYNGTVFILQGEGGSGNALPEDVVLGKTFTNDDGEAVGTRVSYAAGESMSYTKLGLTAMPPKTHIFNSPLGLSAATMGMCTAKDGSGYYITFLDGTLLRLAKFDNYGKLLWNIQVSNTPATSTMGVPLEGTRDGGVCVYMRETGRNDNSLIKYNSAGQWVRKYYVPVTDWPVDVKIDSDGTIFTAVSNDISRLDVDDGFSSTATNALRTWNISRSPTNSAIVVYSDYVYFVYGLGSSTFLGRITKGPSAPVLSTYAINPWSDENIIGTSLIGDGSGRLYVGSTAGRLYALNWNLGKSWETTTNSTAIYDITFNNNKIYVLGRLSGVTDTTFNMVSAVKTISYTGAYENEFPVLIQTSFVNSGMDNRKGQGQLLKFTSDPPNNLIVGLQRSTTLYLNNLQIQP